MYEILQPNAMCDITYYVVCLAMRTTLVGLLF